MREYYITTNAEGRPSGFWDTSERPKPTGNIIERIEMVPREDNLWGDGLHSGIHDYVPIEIVIDYIKVTASQYKELRENSHTRIYVDGKISKIESNDILGGK